MGQFISKCPKCEKEHYWFLVAVEILCECGYLISPKEIEESWKKIYSEYLQTIGKSSL